ncbi:NUDIX domain-containing protein [Streptomyces californicus]|uniref:NUDIX domain-containing protein n=1 Tax=Streptomyces californicus TaxID=67351 RepID=UPI0033D313B2
MQGGRVLFVRRWVSEGALSWRFPAGRIESGESAGEAAAREAREETGLLVTP